MFVVACIGPVVICLFIPGSAEHVEMIVNEHYLSYLPGMLAGLVFGKAIGDQSQKKE
jgi:hypothetical protein